MVGRRFFLSFVGSVILAGCVSGGAGGGRSAPDLITRDDLVGLEPISAYEAIQRLRPRWLQSRGATSIRGGPTYPRVHVDQAPASSLDVLRSLPVTEIETIQYRNASDATTRYGTGYTGGVIEVRTRS